MEIQFQSRSFQWRRKTSNSNFYPVRPERRGCILSAAGHRRGYKFRRRSADVLSLPINNGKTSGMPICCGKRSGHAQSHANGSPTPPGDLF
ncbi:hypothetical protein EVAR_49502_1 [Eumeta japonica]|uniref:Uncharacterized protein n=1 Tax=Eumeta variegata TaxID=151549 RepID=A0A4C1VYK4_EUMVA|nr:hypothetical protein EVAR_49502_1 [Eumeta japonica]